jgi:hypothetical protein
VNNKQAVARLKKLLGPRVVWQENERALSAEKREAAHVLACDLREQERAVKAEAVARREALLSDPTYRALCAKQDALRKQADVASSEARQKPITVGTMSGTSGFSLFHIKADGDTWDEIVAAVESQS